MRSVVCLIVCALLAEHCVGQSSAEYLACADGAKVQFEMNKCASEEAARSEKSMEASLDLLTNQMKGDGVAIARLRDEEQVWKRFRDAYLAAMFPAKDKQVYGTQVVEEIDLARSKLTLEHKAQLEELLKHYEPPE